MKAKVIRMHWHDKKPVFSLSFDPTYPKRLVTAGGDNNVRIWRMVDGEKFPQFSCTLSKHISSVNCVRFGHHNGILASAGDSGTLIFWRQQTEKNAIETSFSDFEEEEIASPEYAEHWSVIRSIRAGDGEDIYDIAWSPDDKHVIIGLTDNTAQIWNVESGKCVTVLKDHGHFIQGVAWDPLNDYIVTQSCDKSAKIWSVKSKTNGSIKVKGTCKLSKDEQKMNIFQDETLVTFFRRCSFSPDGSLLVLVAGKTAEDTNSSMIVPRRAFLDGSTVAKVSGFTTPILGCKFNHILFKTLSKNTADHEPLHKHFELADYRLVYALFSVNEVYIMDTDDSRPIACIKDLHYGSLTDISWSSNGHQLIVAGTDGFCSLITFEHGDIGEPFTEQESLDMISSIRKKYSIDEMMRRKDPKRPVENGFLPLPSSDQFQCVEPSSIGEDVEEQAKEPDQEAAMTVSSGKTEDPVINYPKIRRIQPQLIKPKAGHL